jgi:hypothetical protein
MHLQAYLNITPEEEEAFWASTGVVDKLMEEAEQCTGWK